MGDSEPIRSCGFAVFKRKGEEIRFLLLKSARDDLWGLPKGHLLPGETPLEGALRELKEETGFDDVAVVREFSAAITYQVQKEGASRPKQVDYFLGEKKSHEVRLSAEHTDYRWVTLCQAEELIAFENLIGVLRKAHDAVWTGASDKVMRRKRGARAAGLLLALIVIMGVALRTQNFHRLGYSNRDAFPIESAERHRYIRMVAEGGGIPRIDREVQHPQGFNTRTDTIAQEYLFGYAYRLLSFAGVPLETFIRYLLRFFWALTAIPIYLITLHTTGSRRGALLSALFFVAAMPSLRRSLGNEIYREQISFLPLGLHFYFLLRAMSCRREADVLASEKGRSKSQREFYAWAVLSGLFLVLTLATWKLNRFYYAALVMFFVPMMLSEGRRAMAVRLLAVFAVMSVAASLLLETPLKYDLFPFSAGMVLGYALLGAGTAQLKLKKPLLSAAVFVGVAALLWALRPETPYYSHVWDTLFARLRYLWKPDAPSLLSFEARHYWVPPYTTPTLFMFINDFLLPLMAASVAAIIYLKRALKRESEPSEELLLYMLAAFLLFYLMFYKLMTFLIFFASIFLGLSLSRAATLPRRWRNLALGLTLAAVGLALYQSQTWEDNYLARGLRSMGLKPLFIPQAVPDGATEELIKWFRDNTRKEEAVLAEFPVSTALLAYADRAVVLHALFEGENRARFREFSFALAGDEGLLYGMMKKYQARYFVYSAHFSLRTDSNMSYRYTADAMEIKKDWALYAMHFHPERLKRFGLVYQNSAYRVFRLLNEGEETSFTPSVYAPIFDESLLANLRFQTPPGITGEEAFLYTVVSAYSDLRDGLLLTKAGKREAGIGFLRRSLDTFPFIPETHAALAAFYRSTGDTEKASAHLERASALNAGGPLR